jgi:hypothetical protein
MKFRTWRTKLKVIKQDRRGTRQIRKTSKKESRKIKTASKRPKN